jgi:hypothetical protein
VLASAISHLRLSAISYTLVVRRTIISLYHFGGSTGNSISQAGSDEFPKLTRVEDFRIAPATRTTKTIKKQAHFAENVEFIPFEKDESYVNERNIYYERLRDEERDTKRKISGQKEKTEMDSGVSRERKDKERKEDQRLMEVTTNMDIDPPDKIFSDDDMIEADTRVYPPSPRQTPLKPQGEFVPAGCKGAFYHAQRNLRTYACLYDKCTHIYPSRNLLFKHLSSHYAHRHAYSVPVLRESTSDILLGDDPI